jgi:hypothetical protein
MIGEKKLCGDREKNLMALKEFGRRKKIMAREKKFSIGEKCV